MFKSKQIFSLIRAAAVSIGFAAITFGAQTNPAQAAGQKVGTQISHGQKGSSSRWHHHHRHHHHRRTGSHKGNKRVPKAKSLKTESY